MPDLVYTTANITRRHCNHVPVTHVCACVYSAHVCDLTPGTDASIYEPAEQICHKISGKQANCEEVTDQKYVNELTNNTKKQTIQSQLHQRQC